MVALDGVDRLVFADGPENPALSLLVPEALRGSAEPGAVFELCPAALALASGSRRPPYARSGGGVADRLRPCPEPARGELAGRIAPPSGRPAGLSRQCRSERACRFRGLRRGRPRRRGRRLWTGAARPASRRFGHFGAAGGLVRAGDPERSAGSSKAASNACSTSDQMGDLFKAVALVSPRLPRPVRFRTCRSDAVITLDLLETDGAVRHAFFTRQGGVSGGLFASLNCGFGAGDPSENVARNRALAIERLDLRAERLVTCRQVHSAMAVVVDRPWHREDAPSADGMATPRPGRGAGCPGGRLRPGPASAIRSRA